MTSVFVVGLGRMGKGIVKNLTKKGYAVLGYDVYPGAYRQLEGVPGFTPLRSLSEALTSDYVFLLLPTSRELIPTLEQLSGAHGVVINMSTIGLEDARVAASKAPQRYLTAMIEGGPANAEAGTMTLYVGGSRDVYDASQQVLKDMGTPIYLGTHEAATAMKLFSTAILLANVAILAELSHALSALGLDSDLVIKALSSGGADSAQLRARLPIMLSRSYRDLFSAELGSYVLREAISAARSLSSPYSPLLSAVGELLEAARSLGLGQHDVSELAELYRALATRKG
ncbi:MAG: NAD(P)-dependent oxidoreductase [Acidilobus sp.]